MGLQSYALACDDIRLELEQALAPAEIDRLRQWSATRTAQQADEALAAFAPDARRLIDATPAKRKRLPIWRDDSRRPLAIWAAVLALHRARTLLWEAGSLQDLSDLPDRLVAAAAAETYDSVLRSCLILWPFEPPSPWPGCGVPAPR